MDEKNILSLLEEERKRIADDLHDTTIQDLVYLSQQLDITNLYFDKDINQARLELFLAKKYIKDIIENMRNTIYDLRPMSFDDIGWDSAFETLKNQIEKNDFKANFNISKPDNLDEIYAITIFRVVKEACCNSIKHSKGDFIDVIISYDDYNIIIQIADNGIGFNVYEKNINKDYFDKSNDNHFGLKIMYERVKHLSGSMNITSSEEGTKFDIVIPYNY